jgi:nitrate/nitrite transporter NarK
VLYSAISLQLLNYIFIFISPLIVIFTFKFLEPNIFFSLPVVVIIILIIIVIVFVQVLEEGRASFQNMNPAEESSSAASNVLFWWQLFTGTLLFSFALSCVSQFAQFYQMTIDQEASDKLREHLPPSVRTSLLSPG